MLETKVIAIVGSIAAIALISGSVWLTHRLDDAKYADLDASFASYRAQVEKDNAGAQLAARSALQTQINNHQIIEKRNAQIMASLQDQFVGAQRDAEFAKRLLASAAANSRAAAASHSVPATAGGLTADAAAQPSGGRSAPDLLGLATAAAAEARQCFEHYTALQLELNPQL